MPIIAIIVLIVVAIVVINIVKAVGSGASGNLPRRTGSPGIRMVSQADGFRVFGPAHAAGRFMRYRYRSPADNLFYEGEVELDAGMLADGQFIYTGVLPMEMAMMGLSGMAGGASSDWVDPSNGTGFWDSSRNTSSTPSTHHSESFGGFPSAY